MRRFDLDMPKLKSLIHYVCACYERSSLGKTKLNKILWFSDVAAYRDFGAPITGETYVKQKYGPVPSHIDEALRELFFESKLIERDAPIYKYSKKEFISLAQPDISLFSAAEMEIINETAQIICDNYTAAQISEMSHDMLWKTADMNEELPYEATLVKYVEPSPEAIKWAQSMLIEQCEVAS
ncbi:hypothetical protein FACS1894187_21580 [Synergistales bacterium]|nr:hypothetical protein FACS1894187_21580 [Synergistales bacterium]